MYKRVERNKNKLNDGEKKLDENVEKATCEFLAAQELSETARNSFNLGNQRWKHDLHGSCEWVNDCSTKEELPVIHSLQKCPRTYQEEETSVKLPVIFFLSRFN